MLVARWIRQLYLVTGIDALLTGLMFYVLVSAIREHLYTGKATPGDFFLKYYFRQVETYHCNSKGALLDNLSLVGGDKVVDRVVDRVADRVRKVLVWALQRRL